jgi:hypothetical protein
MQQHVASLIAVAFLSSALTAAPPQPAGVAEIAAKMSGRWKLNVELSPGLVEQEPPGRGRRGSALFSIASPQRAAPAYPPSNRASSRRC